MVVKRVKKKQKRRSACIGKGNKRNIFKTTRTHIPTHIHKFNNCDHKPPASVLSVYLIFSFVILLNSARDTEACVDIVIFFISLLILIVTISSLLNTIH